MGREIVHTNKHGIKYWLDCDGDSHAFQPDDYTKSLQAHQLSQASESSLYATFANYALGCNIKWSEYLWGLSCGCRGGEHQCDQQCSSLREIPLEEVSKEHLKIGGASFDNVSITPLEAIRTYLRTLLGGSSCDPTGSNVIKVNFGASVPK